MLKKIEDLTTPGILKGLNTQYNFLALQKDQTPNSMDVKINYDGSVEKRLGSNTQNAVVIANSAAEGFAPNTSGLLTGFVSYWNLNETQGTRNDSKGVVPLLAFGNPLYTAGIRGNAALFNINTQQCLYQPYATTLSGNPSFTFATWFFMTSTITTLQRCILSKQDSPASALPTLLLHMDGPNGSQNFIDSSTNNWSMTAVGSAQLSVATYQFGGASGLFDGVTAWLIASSASTASLNMGTNDFTVDFWANFSAVPTNMVLVGKNLASDFSIGVYLGNLYIDIGGAMIAQGAFTPTLGTWYHIAGVRYRGIASIYSQGVALGSGAAATLITSSAPLVVGAFETGGVALFNGYLDELRIINGLAAWTGNSFSVPTTAYPNPALPNSFEYSLYVDTDNLVTFSVSSSGLAANGTVKAASFGTISTSNWYNAVAWIDSSNQQIGVSVNLAYNTSSYNLGLYTGTAPFSLAAVNGGATNFFDGRIDETGYWNIVLNSSNRIDLYDAGSGNTYSAAFSNYPWACFDFGASALRWLLVGAGTGVYASSNLGVNWVTIATDRTASYQYYDRANNVLVMTSDSFDPPLYWAGSAGTYASAFTNNNPICKYNIDFQGFLIMLNSNTQKRGFYYIPDNVLSTNTAWLSFNIPSSYDDEITGAFVLRRYLYVSTRYTIYRVSYVGGNPDWSYVQVKNWGFVPRTAQKLVITNNQPGVGFFYSIGEVMVGMDYSRKIRIFDGSGDQIISNNVELDNGMCEFALNKISLIGSGPQIMFAQVDPNQNVYKMVCAIGANSTQTTHMLNYDGRSMALYTYAKQQYNCMCMAESSNTRFLMAFDRSSNCHMLDSGNLDGNTSPINDYFESPVLFSKSPSQSSKAYQTDLFFSNTTAGNIYYSDRLDFSNTYKLKRVFNINGSSPRIVHWESIDVPQGYNAYQFQITSSMGTGQPWRLQRYDHFTQGEGIGKGYNQ